MKKTKKMEDEKKRYPCFRCVYLKWSYIYLTKENQRPNIQCNKFGFKSLDLAPDTCIGFLEKARD